MTPHFCMGGRGESHRPLTPILLKGIPIHLPFLSRYFCKVMPFFWEKVVHTPPICITTCLPFVSQYFCRSIRVRGRWNTPKVWAADLSKNNPMGYAANASSGGQFGAPGRSWKPGHQQHPGPKNQDSQRMLNQPRGSSPENES